MKHLLKKTCIAGTILSAVAILAATILTAKPIGIPISDSEAASLRGGACKERTYTTCTSEGACTDKFIYKNDGTCGGQCYQGRGSNSCVINSTCTAGHESPGDECT